MIKRRPHTRILDNAYKSIDANVISETIYNKVLFFYLQQYPDEGLASVVQNVFDFDSYNKELKETVVTTLHKNGIPVGANPRNVHLAKQ